MKVTKVQKQRILLVIGVVVFLTLMLVGQDVWNGKEAVNSGILRGEGESEVYQETFVLEQENGQKQDINVTVYPRQMTETEKQKMLQQAVEEFEGSYLGKNPSAEQVFLPLVFAASYCQEKVLAQYSSDHPDLVWEDGSVETENVDAAGELVTVEVTFLCQDAKLVYTCYIRVVPPVLSVAEQERKDLETLVQQREEESRDEARFVLPTTLDGQRVIWHKKLNPEGFVLLFLGGIAVIAILQKGKQDEKQKRQAWEQCLLQEYPQMVIQLSLLLGAGMNLSAAWERMVKRYLTEQVEESVDKKASKKQYLEEMLITYREIKDGTNMRMAYERFGGRIGLAPYRKMTALLLQNMDKGNRDLVRLLDMEAELALEEQKKQVRRQGEEAGTKLLFPMLLLFVLILIVIMVPALQSF